MELPINYPGVDRSKMHKAFLVTNGTITDPVRVQIADRNDDNVRKNRQYAQLEVISKDSLLKSFVDAQGRFVPRDLPDIRTFLELYLDEGRGMLPKESLFAVLEGAVFAEAPSKKSDAIDAITSSLIIVSYLLNSFEQSKNYYAMAEGWSILAACIARYAGKHSLPQGQWRSSLDLVMAEVKANLAMLRREAIGRPDFLEGDIRTDGGVMLNARTTIVLGALACHELLPDGSTGSDKSPDEVLKLIREHLRRRSFWGESAFPYVFYIIKFLEARNETALALSLLEELFVVLVDANYQQQGPVFPCPYRGVEEVLATSIPDRLQDADFEGYRGSSYVLRSVLEMLVRRGRRDVIAAKWRRLTYCQQHEFIPDSPEDVFAWRTKDGTNTARFPNQTQSWSALVAESSEVISIPSVYREFTDVLRFHIIVCPHRATAAVIRWLDGGS
jgi:hypothetical protein